MSLLHAAPGIARRPIMNDRVRSLSLALREEFSTPFLIYEGSTGELLCDGDAAGSPPSPPAGIAAEVLAIALRGRPQVRLARIQRFRLILPIRDDRSMLVAIGELPALAGSPPASRLEQARLQKWLESVHSRLSAPGESTARHRIDPPHAQPLRTLVEASRELTDLLAGMGIPGEPVTDEGHILGRVAAVLPAEALIWVPADPEHVVAIEGERRLSGRDGRELAHWLAGRPDWDASGCLILNRAASSGLGARFPWIVNLMALRADGRNPGGWLIAANKREAASASDRSPEIAGHETRILRSSDSTRPDCGVAAGAAPFRQIDLALLKPFASLLALQTRSMRRQSQVQDVFAGLIRSLIAAIDAKDSYTCGHSERVARVAVELGRELRLDESELGDVYLAGLLHDVGKIGVPDSVLGKRASLTSDEFAQIRQHVVIGCRILEGFGGISHLLPSVLSHHERYDGAGYPHGLKGEAIPRPARILAVADCYDAMSTARPYRAALARDQIERNLAHGRDRQWDGEVIDAFFRARDRIYSIRASGVGDSVWFALNTGPERAASR